MLRRMTGNDEHSRRGAYRVEQFAPRPSTASDQRRGGRAATAAASNMPAMSLHGRYRTDAGSYCIDVRVRSSQQLFDRRDPAPFRERDLDDEAVAYLMDAAADLPAAAPLRIVIWLGDDPDPVPDELIAAAVRAHFGYECERADRDIRTEATRRRIFLAAGSIVLVTCLLLSELTRLLAEGPLRDVLREGLVITGWVAMWRPLEALFYDRWPLARRRRLLERIRQAPVQVHRAAEQRSSTF